MVGQSNAAPVIIKRKKIIKGGGHHGGAWKVAYADFVTAMMAFFMLMWLLNATTEKQRKGISDYFSPTIAVSRISGGGDGMFGGDSTFTEQTMAHNGTGASARTPTEAEKARGEAATGEAAAAAAAEQGRMAQIAQALMAQGGESMTMERMLRHVVTKVTDEGLVVEIFDLPDAPLFVDDTAEPTGETRKITALIAEVLQLAQNQVAVNGHMRRLPITLKNNPAWDLTAARAQALRQMLESDGIDATRMARISGHADRKPATQDPSAIRNNRMEIILLRKDR
ncbi:chemotaxis MotB protein [Cypionkella aquatica]|uniref:Chemotaxis MotB protein n=1 Tax=Cypionkella aquatica TaxID=1756042 RepID=A0AA37U2Q8_9RHOB|nr:flagellar motor protein MotB [Cypionkella aquatica]GLS85211.1 chemotaxis MotB protein [Cypionkella aquatica]